MNTMRAVLLGIGLIAACFAMPVRGADDAVKTSPPPAKGDSGRAAPATPVERFKAIVDGLSLTDDQKLKAGVLFDAARDEMKKLDAKMDPTALKQRSKAIFDKLRTDIADVLTDEQKLEVIKKMMPPGPGAIIDKIKEQLSSPESKLTAEQKQKAFEVLDDAKKKLEDIRTKALNGDGKDAPAKMTAVLQEMKVKLSKVLAPKDGATKKTE